jgi:predicted heme/steroid binding protein
MVLSSSKENSTTPKNWTFFLCKIDRVAAWVLLVVMIMYGLTGYAMIKGFADYEQARALHFAWLGAIGLIAFVIHTAYAIRLALMRWRIWNAGTKVLLIILYLTVIGVFGYLHFFYIAPKVINTPTTANVQTTEKIFTAETLKQYNGLNGQPAYVAIDGVVYDLSTVFRNGDHAGYQAGVDQTAAFYRQHSASLLKNFQVVGQYQKR